MVRHECLPTCKTALDMAVHFEKLVAGFSRYHKYTLRTELRYGRRRDKAPLAASSVLAQYRHWRREFAGDVALM